jgi:hypothetical protein
VEDPLLNVDDVVGLSIDKDPRGSKNHEAAREHENDNGEQDGQDPARGGKLLHPGSQIHCGESNS